MQRLSFLDSYRAIAISAVAFYHYFSLWSPSLRNVAVYPYGQQFSEIFVFRYGYFGVELFFLISGFVITLTLQSCDNLFDFAVKRFARLWPALLFCSLLAFPLISTFPLPGVASPTAADFLPSLTTIGPRFFDFLGVRSEYLIGSVWSLFVEIRFYLICGMVYFWVSRRHFVLIVLLFSLAAMSAALANGRLEGPVGTLLTTLMLVRHIGWLALGAYCYDLYRGNQTTAETLAAFGNWIALVALNWSLPEQAGSSLAAASIALAMPAIFLISTLSPVVQRMLSRPLLVRIGAASYSLYLLHEIVGIRLITLISPGLPTAIQLMLVGVVYAAMIAFACGVYVLIEMPGREAIKRLLLRSAPGHAASKISA